jgi:pSer/pThr/pTyr-binding forkhead associated (FHA) protein
MQSEGQTMSNDAKVPATVPMNDLPMAEPLTDTSSYESVKTLNVEKVNNPAETSSYTPMQAEAAETIPTADPVSSPTLSTPKLVVIRGQKLHVEYPLYTGENYIGRTDEKPVDVDLEDQESADRIWCSRQHARIVASENGLSIEDLGSQNGTFVNRARIYPGQVRPLVNGDIIQVGTVQLKLKI